MNRNFIKITFILFALLIGGEGFLSAEENPWIKIVKNVPKESRKNAVGISSEECEAERVYWHKTGCVKAEHLDYLRSEVACPLCDRNNKPAYVTFQGCFSAGTRIWVESKKTGQSEWVSIENLVSRTEEYYIWALAKNANLREMRFEKLEPVRPLQGPEQLPLVVITTASGEKISLTEKHPVLLATGEMAKANSIAVGQVLITMEGKNTTVVEVSRELSNNDVYNVMTSGGSDVEHVLIAEGLLMGDRKWQNMLAIEEQPLFVR